MKNLLILIICLLASGAMSQKPTGIFKSGRDIGSPKMAGDASYDEISQSYTLSGSGYNIWFERDEFNYLFNKLKGDFILTANFAFEGTGTDPHRKVGWMIRASEDDNAVHASAVLHGDGLTVLQWRVLRGAFMRDPEDEIFAPKPNYSIIQLERAGKTVIFRAAHPGEPLPNNVRIVDVVSNPPSGIIIWSLAVGSVKDNVKLLSIIFSFS